MSIVVVGGHSRNVGKTSVVAGLISALPEFGWTAMKITQYGHNECSLHGEPCECTVSDSDFAIEEERNSAGGSDTSRFLKAGAEKVYWVRTRQGFLAEVVPQIRERLGQARNAIIESNSILKFVRPHLYLTVLDPGTADFKPSAQEFLDRADAVLLHAGGQAAAWSAVSLKPVAERPVFKIQPPAYVTDEVVDFVRHRLACTPHAGD